MAYVRQAGTLVRRVTGTPDWPYVATAVLCAAGVIEVAFRPAAYGPNASFTLVLALAVTLPIGLARGHPTAAAVLIVAATTLTLLPYGFPPVAGLVALAVSLYLAGRRGFRTALLVLPFLLYALSPVATAAKGGRPFAVLLLALAAGATATGIAHRTRAEAAQRDESARAMADSLLEHVARGERARIARELHDVVAHHISMIAVQAEAARLTTPGMPPEGATRLVAIGDTARTALTEMRRLLGVLHHGEEAAERAPQPTLRELDGLIARSRAAGLDVTLVVEGDPQPLPPGKDLAAYRVVQEALTNAIKYAGAAETSVTVRWEPSSLELAIVDRGGMAMNGTNGSGHGLVGMEERMRLYDGSVRAGPVTGGGFEVVAKMPL
jgi:signal transduction histidine kinase